MGDIDIRVKNFVKLRSIFAQLFSEGVFHGKVKIDPDKLQELDTVNQETVRLEDGQLKGMERLRDAQKITMLFDDKMAFQLIMGVEGQTGIHYYMPVRCMELDAMSYSAQCRNISEKAKRDKKLKKYSDGVPKGTKIIPVVTLVLYTGRKEWDAPLSVYDMLDIPDTMKEWAKQMIPDYRMNLIDAKHMKEEDVERFDEDLKAFLLLQRKHVDREKLKSLVVKYRETWYALSAVTDNEKYIEYADEVLRDEKGGVKMDTALDYLIAEGEAKGEARGKAIGRSQGETRVNKLGMLLAEAGRTADFMKSLSDPIYQQKLFAEFGMEEK